MSLQQTRPSTQLGAGTVVQTSYFQTGSLVSGTASIPWDDTIPQVSEGFEVMSLSITPTKSTNLLLIESFVNAATNSGVGPTMLLTVALFGDGMGNDALASSVQGVFMSSSVTAGGSTPGFTLRHQMVAGSTSPMTFRTRLGSDAGLLLCLNGHYSSASRRLGGSMASSMRITEVSA